MLCSCLLTALQGFTMPALPLDEYVAAQDEEANDRFRPWKKNYFLVVYNSDLTSLPSPAPGGENLDWETNFQLSIRTEFLPEHWLDPWSINIGYTGTSFWQMMDGNDSSPFRTTDHRPELFFESDESAENWLFRISPAHHESNGESGAASRSWNYSYVEAIWHSDLETMRLQSFDRKTLDEVKGVRLGLKVWKEWNVSEDSNPDIDDYYGNFELNADWFTSTEHNHAFSAMLRNNLDSGDDNRTTLRLEWSYNPWPETRFMVQFFTGYGLNLLDYDRHQQSIGFGIEVSP